MHKYALMCTSDFFLPSCIVSPRTLGAARCVDGHHCRLATVGPSLRLVTASLQPLTFTPCFYPPSHCACCISIYISSSFSYTHLLAISSDLYNQINLHLQSQISNRKVIFRRFESDEEFPSLSTKLL